MDAFPSLNTVKLLKYWFLFSTYILLGSAVFIALENNGGNAEELQRKRSLQQSLKSKMKSKFNISGAEFDALTQDFVDAYSVPKKVTWDFNGAFVFVIQLVTTIGYGNITPITHGGRLFSIVYGFFGIIITVMTLQVHGENMFAFQQKLITKLHKVCLKKDSTPQQLPEKCLLFNALLAIILIVTGAIVEIFATSGTNERWNFVDGIYVWFITFTTVGFGDLIPGKQLPGWFVCLYTLLGLCVMSALLNALTALSHLSLSSVVKTCVSCCIPQDVDTVPDTSQAPCGAPRAEGIKNEDAEAASQASFEGASKEQGKENTPTKM